MQKIRAVVFDLDGTLVDSLADIAAAVNSTLVRHGRSAHALEAYNTMVGWGLSRLLVTASAERPFSPGEFPEVYSELLSAYRARPVVHTRAYPGIVELLSRLAGQVPLGVLSNKDHGMTQTIVGTLFPTTEFAGVWGSRPGVPHKPDPTALIQLLNSWGVEPGECAYLGDSNVDMETATRAGALACGAAWGFRSAAELRASGAFGVFDNPGDFGDWVVPQLTLDKPDRPTETERGE